MKAISIKFLLGCLVSLTVLPVANAQDIKQQLQDFFSGFAAKGQFNGNILVAEKGKIIYQQSFGYANFEQRRLNNKDSEFQLASITKTFTAVCVLQLAEKGRIQLDSSYAKYFPMFPYKGMTIRQLLSHSSGLSDQDLAKGMGNYYRSHTGKQKPRLPAIIALVDAPLKLQPGEKWWYCNMAYELLALLVEKQSGLAYPAYLSQNILKPAAMQHTYLRNAFLNTAPRKDFSDNYDYVNAYDTTRTKYEGRIGYFNDGTIGASNMISTTSDLLLFHKALVDGRLLKQTTLELATTPTTLKDGSVNRIWLNFGVGNLDNGLGWFVFEDQSMGKMVWHTGGMPGCATAFLRNLAKDQVVIVLDNTNSEKLYAKAFSAMLLLNGREPLQIKNSLTKAYAKVLNAEGKDKAESFLQIAKGDTLHYVLGENDMNNLGYSFMENKRLAEAVIVLELNTRLFPNSDNVYNSYGEVLNESGRKEEAIAMYQKSLEINPDNEDSKQALEKLTRSS